MGLWVFATSHTCFGTTVQPYRWKLDIFLDKWIGVNTSKKYINVIQCALIPILFQKRCHTRQVVQKYLIKFDSVRVGCHFPLACPGDSFGYFREFLRASNENNVRLIQHQEWGWLNTLLEVLQSEHWENCIVMCRREPNKCKNIAEETNCSIFWTF